MENNIVPTETVFELLRNGKFSEAYLLAEKSFTQNYDDSVAVFLYKVLHFWKKRAIDNAEKKNPVEYGDSLLQVWNKIKAKYFIANQTEEEDPFFLSFKTYALGEVIAVYEQDRNNDETVAYKTGICYKHLGKPDEAIRCLTKTTEALDSARLAELADCYALLGEESRSRVIFKEAFSGNPQNISLEYLESPGINQIIRKVRELGFSEKELKEWIPVYALLWGFFNVKREMKPVECQKIQQEIKYLKSMMKMEPEEIRLIKPRLINNYLRLIEYYSLFEKNKGYIEDALLNIKRLDSEIYRLYAN